ncbi:type-1 angiotensin II receptor-associated protein-like isoform X1 [Schistocerca gregaria]|uniref:type-1 angiotensin II receptor-associated protein-like isoform X1 n=1 Tax=Schistocerca gregaria TaxID=7010 RepID=UPI00211E8C0A|nr:type-1 angiotensin II receptor-associated protein-like isoform X1 [Schistocerca gregaria]XP_049846516.1 type-1 angiotensin II receptor-associated protein-like isoform X1 [Schistocerca gregaria]
MVELNIINNPLKVIFIIHFILSTWALQGDWCPDSYFFYSLLFFIALFWAIKDKESSDATEMALMLNVLCIALDIVILIIYFPSSSRVSFKRNFQHHMVWASGEKFSSGMAVLNLLVRPVTAIALYRLHGDRSGNTNTFPGIGGIFGNSGRTRTVYEDIDSGTHQAVPSNNAAGTSTIPSLYSAQGTEKIPPPYGA